MSIDVLSDLVRLVLAKSDTVTPQFIRETIDKYSDSPVFQIDGAAKEKLARQLETDLDVTMESGSVVLEEFKPWLESRRAEIDPYYWTRYKRLLQEKNFPLKVIARLDEVTDRTLDLMENPLKEGEWDRRGLVVGHVQSGKTANYIGLICKAADAGYRVIVIIAGIHNNLRNQTQERIDEGFVGRDSSRMEERRSDGEIGVGRYDKKQFPLTVTTCKRDFNRQTAETVGIRLRQLTVPAVLVIKKNTKTLNNLIDWLREHNAQGSQIKDAPMLLIDDEADNASIDISSSPGKASRINGQIRELLNLFDKKCYVGYTATPFANIFIDPETNDDMLKSDLFPRDFIFTLDPPTNYFGATRIFGDDPDCSVIRNVEDHQDILPVRHKKNHEVKELPESLKEAIRVFVLARAIRLLREHDGSHNSMLVNVSRFTNVQDQVRDLIHDYLGQLKHRVRYEAGKSPAQACRDEHMAALHRTWEKEFGELEFEWAAIQSALHKSLEPITVLTVNSRSTTALNYRDYKDTGRNVIAVGGFSLSRGLTLEGLSVSYFLRNSIMYDTLMQMGRWFGYRPGYEDVCRVWMSTDAEGWYEHITESMEELRDEIREMERANLTPRDFGLKVRSHPDTLIVTARNKMRTAEKVRVRIGLANEFIETVSLFRSPERIERNINGLSALVADIMASCEHDPQLENHNNNYLWRDVPAEPILRFISGWQNHPASMHTDPAPVRQYVSKRIADELAFWDVALINAAHPQRPKRSDYVEHSLLPVPVVCETRTHAKHSDAAVIHFTKRRLGSRGDEKLGLDEELISKAEADYRQQENKSEDVRINFPDRIYRKKRTRPLLILHLVRPLQDKMPTADQVMPGWGISFPESKYEDPTVEYVVNTTWWKEHYGEDLDDEDAGEPQDE